MSNTHPFTVIEGGLARNRQAKQTKTFLRARAVQSRLMGVIGLHLEFRQKLGPDQTETLHQLFYLDVEEYGLDTYKGIPLADVKGPHTEVLDKELQSMFGGLGSPYQDITQREAYFLIQQYAARNTKAGEPLPGETAEYRFILAHPLTLTAEEHQVLMDKLCTPIRSDYERIHYFLMRCCGRDYEAAAYLAVPGLDLHQIPFPEPATFYRNVIDPAQDGGYVCESLIDRDQGPYQMISHLTVGPQGIDTFQVLSTHKLSHEEANLITARELYILAFRILSSPEETQEALDCHLLGSLTNEHENGTLKLLFQPNNDHVNQPTYRLDDDTYAMILVSADNELLLCSHTEAVLQTLSQDFFHPDRGILKHSQLLPLGAYLFQFPILQMYLDSDFYSFFEFIKYLTEKQDQ